MAYLDRAARRLDLKIVYWGPGRGGKTTSLRSLHGAFAPTDRGDIQSVETNDERTFFFDYAPLELPKYGEYQLRVHAYTVPGQDMYIETRRRILRGADGVIFVADATPSAAAGNESSWIQLDQCLTAMGRGQRPLPVLVAVNKLDLPGAIRAAETMKRLAAVAPQRAPIDVVETTAIQGLGIVRCFGRLLVAAAEHALTSDRSSGAEPVRDRFLAELARHVRGAQNGVPEHAAPARQKIVVDDSRGPDDSAGLEVALDAGRRLAQRDRDVRDLHLQQAHGRLLVDIGRLCLEAKNTSTLASSVLSTLAWNLEASVAWIGLPDANGGAQVFDAHGPAVDGEAVARFARGLAERTTSAEVAVVDVPQGSGFRADAERRRGFFAPFATGDGRWGFLLLVGDRERGVAGGADDVLGPAGACVGITLSRLDALAWLQDSNIVLERRVAERTQDLRRERDSLERRVVERTGELEAAKRSTVEAERRLLDLERAEGVRRLAAGLVHELNNPLGAASANIDFAHETIRAIVGSLPVAARDEADSALEALADARGELRKVSSNLTSLFEGAAASRRAAVRTSVSGAARDALAAHMKVHPGFEAPTIVEQDRVACGVAPAECSRWLFRLLGILASDRRASIRVLVDRADEGPRVTFVCTSLSISVESPDLEQLSKEIAKSGGSLEVSLDAGRPVARVVLPRAVGEATPMAGAAVR